MRLFAKIEDLTRNSNVKSAIRVSPEHIPLRFIKESIRELPATSALFKVVEATLRKEATA